MKPPSKQLTNVVVTMHFSDGTKQEREYFGAQGLTTGHLSADAEVEWDDEEMRALPTGLWEINLKLEHVRMWAPVDEEKADG